MQRDVLPAYTLYQATVLLGKHAGVGVHNTLAPTRLATLMLFAIVHMAIFLKVWTFGPSSAPTPLVQNTRAFR
jgi:hypothetical protein